MTPKLATNFVAFLVDSIKSLTIGNARVTNHAAVLQMPEASIGRPIYEGVKNCINQKSSKQSLQQSLLMSFNLCSPAA
jgi:hypothetical protein